MSRIIVKNLPKTITAKKLENLFASKGPITDLQLKYNKEGVFRQFAFVGYKTEEEAQAAKEYFHNTFVNTSRIQVEICANLGDPNKPKAWKKQGVTPSTVEAANKDKDKEKNSKQKKKDGEIPEELMKDAKFKEFLEVNKSRSLKPVWAEDVDVAEGSESEQEAGDASSSDSDYDENYEKALKSDGDDSGASDLEESNEKVNEKETTPSQKQSKDEKSPLKKENYDDSFTVKIRNLPYKCKKKQIKKFLQPLKVVSLRLPPRNSGFAYVKFKTEKDMKLALTKNKGYLDGHRVDVVKYTRKDTESPKFKNNGQNENDKEKNEELLAETGRIYVRNLGYTVTESEIEELFKKYGPLAEVHLPIDLLTKRIQGFAFVSYVFAEHAVKAFSELDGTIFQGRLLHLIPAKPKKEYKVDENETDYKKKKESKLKQLSGSSHNWNILFLGMNAVADVIAEKYNVEKSKLLSGDSKESLAVRMALAETDTVMENRKFLIQNGVQLDAFSQADAERSKTVIVVKNLPAKTSAAELNELFSKFGTVGRVVLPPSGIIALIEFENSTEAKNAFKRLAYSRFHQLPLYLEWAPVDGLKPALPDPSKDEQTKGGDETEENKTSEESQTNIEEPVGTTVFVKNLNFETTPEAFKKHFKKCGPVYDATVSTKTDIKTGKVLSMGFGFIRFKDRDSAVKAVQNYQQSVLDGHALELKFANREIKPVTMTKKKKQEVKKQLSAKILVRNIPFEASEKEVKELFSQFGMLKSVRLPRKLDGSNEHRGFGFVEYLTKDNAERAFNALCHSTHFYGRRLVLEWANADTEDVANLREKTARDYLGGEQKKKFKKRKLNEDVALAAARYGNSED